VHAVHVHPADAQETLVAWLSQVAGVPPHALPLQLQPGICAQVGAVFAESQLSGVPEQALAHAQPATAPHVFEVVNAVQPLAVAEHVLPFQLQAAFAVHAI